jgi:hypothetical protein
MNCFLFSVLFLFVWVGMILWFDFQKVYCFDFSMFYASGLLHIWWEIYIHRLLQSIRYHRDWRCKVVFVASTVSSIYHRFLFQTITFDFISSLSIPFHHLFHLTTGFRVGFDLHLFFPFFILFWGYSGYSGYSG